MIGIAWLAEFLCQICRDAGSGALAVKLEFAAKISILMMFFPILTELLHSIIAIL
jgi:stage III sporulation protein AD